MQYYTEISTNKNCNRIICCSFYLFNSQEEAPLRVWDLPRNIHCSQFPDNSNFYLAGILHFFLYLISYFE